MEKIKRTKVYILRPIEFEMSGCKCGNLDPDWSEFQHHLWCNKCNIDFIPEHFGVFDGPVLCSVCELMGIYFDQIDLTTNEIIPGPNGIKHFDKSGVLNV